MKNTLFFFNKFLIACALFLAGQASCSASSTSPNFWIKKFENQTANAEDLQAYVDNRIAYRVDYFKDKLATMQKNGADQKSIEKEIPYCIRNNYDFNYTINCYFLSKDADQIPAECKNISGGWRGLTVLMNRIRTHEKMPLMLIMNDSAPFDSLYDFLNTIEHEITHVFQFFNAASIVNGLAGDDVAYTDCFTSFSSKRSISGNPLTNEQANTFTRYREYCNSAAHVSDQEKLAFLNEHVDAQKFDQELETEADTQAVHFHPRPKEFLKDLQRILFEVSMRSCGTCCDRERAGLGYLSAAAKEKILLNKYGTKFDWFMAKNRKTLGWAGAHLTYYLAYIKNTPCMRDIKVLPHLQQLVKKIQAVQQWLRA